MRAVILYLAHLLKRGFYILVKHPLNMVETHVKVAVIGYCNWSLVALCLALVVALCR